VLLLPLAERPHSFEWDLRCALFGDGDDDEDDNNKNDDGDYRSDHDAGVRSCHYAGRPPSMLYTVNKSISRYPMVLNLGRLM